MDKILSLLGADKLNEETQGELKEKLNHIIEIEAKKLSEAALEEAKTQLVEEYEAKFDTYKDEITSKFSNFTDGVFEDELIIPEQIQEFAKKGQLYNDLIEQFKVRIGVDQGLLDEEVKGILKGAKEEILKLRESNDGNIAKELELKEDAQAMAAQLYLYKKCEGLTEGQRKQVFDILEGITDTTEIDAKFSIISDSERFDPVATGDPEAEKAAKKSKKKGDPKNNEKEVMEDDEKGKGQAEVIDEEDEDKDKIVEDKSPFAQHKKAYLKVLQENKIPSVND
jgi:hypothetical protein